MLVEAAAVRANNLDPLIDALPHRDLGLPAAWRSNLSAPMAAFQKRYSRPAIATAIHISAPF